MIDRRPLVLLVDDDPHVRLATEMMLDDLGCQVLTASSAMEAVVQLAGPLGSSVDAVLTDEKMPGQTGSELLMTIKERWPGLPAAIVSGYAESLPEGVIRLSKPFGTKELESLLRRLSIAI